MSATYLHDLLTDVLASASAAVAQARTGHAAPAIQMISHGPPVIDACEGTGRLAVYLDSLDPRYIEQNGGLPLGRCAVAPFARVIVELWRCYPVPDHLGHPPTVDSEEEAAEGLLIDAWSLWTGMLSDALSGAIVPGPCDTVQLEPLAVLEPNGGAAGIQVPMMIQLDDPGPAGS